MLDRIGEGVVGILGLGGGCQFAGGPVRGCICEVCCDFSFGLILCLARVVDKIERWSWV